MRFSIHDVIAKLNQWRFAPEFRIDFSTPDSLSTEQRSLLDAVQTATARLAEIEQAEIEQAEADAEAEGSSETGGNGHPDVSGNLDFILTICNSYFRLEANSRQLEQEGHESRQLRNIRFALRKMSELMEENEIQCLDLGGQSYDPGRNDVEIIGAAEEREGVTSMMIERCERPAVFWNGKIIQQARAIIVKPIRTDPMLDEGEENGGN